MKLIRNAVIAAGCTLAIGAGALAQQMNTKEGDEEKMPVAGKVTLGTTVTETQAMAIGFRASKLIGGEVHNDENAKIGKVDDLIVAPDGKLSVAILDVGGFVGIAARKVAIPVREFKMSAGKPMLPGATKDELMKLPEFKYMH